MIQITRNLARQLRSVLRRAFHVTSHGPQPAIVFESGPEGLRIRSHSIEAAVQYRQPGNLAPEQITAPLELLADCEGRKEEPLSREVEGTGVLASWRDGSIPQIARYETPRGKQGPFPEVPGNLTANEPRLWQALQDAASTTNPDSMRYALGCLQLRPAGQIVATDGRQVLVQSGFSFPWQDDLLLPANKLFGCRELPQDAPLLVGGGPHRVTLQTGPWTIHLSVQKEGRFPQVDELLRRPEDALTRWQISAADAEFLNQGLSSLRVGDDEFQAVTIDLHKGAVIRAAGPSESPPTELVLSSSPPSGQTLRMATDRRLCSADGPDATRPRRRQCPRIRATPTGKR